MAYNTVKAQRLADRDFDQQIVAAKERAVELLNDMTMRTAIEGECKPIYWQGMMVGHQREFDNRLRIEMLRAYKPDRFKTPGSKVNVNAGNQVLGGNNVIFDGPVMKRVMEMRQEALRKIEERMAQAREIASHDATPLGTGPAPSVPPAT